MNYLSTSSRQTLNCGRDFASCLKGGDVVLLKGEMGAGKTVFTKGIGVGLGVTRPVVSPTFTLLCRYEGTTNLHHIDAYRLSGAAEAEDSGLLDFIGGQDFVTVIEWYEKIAELLTGIKAYRVEILRQGKNREIRIND